MSTSEICIECKRPSQPCSDYCSECWKGIMDEKKEQEWLKNQDWFMILILSIKHKKEKAIREMARRLEELRRWKQ